MSLPVYEGGLIYPITSGPVGCGKIIAMAANQRAIYVLSSAFVRRSIPRRAIQVVKPSNRNGHSNGYVWTLGWFSRKRAH